MCAGFSLCSVSGSVRACALEWMQSGWTSRRQGRASTCAMTADINGKSSDYHYCQRNERRICEFSQNFPPTFQREMKIFCENFPDNSTSANPRFAGIIMKSSRWKKSLFHFFFFLHVSSVYSCVKLAASSLADYVEWFWLAWENNHNFIYFA